jgi:hypothetical protein
VKRETSAANNEVSNEGYEEDGIVSISQAVGDAPECKIYKDKVREGVDNLGGVGGRVVILKKS